MQWFYPPDVCFSASKMCCCLSKHISLTALDCKCSPLWQKTTKTRTQGCGWEDSPQPWPVKKILETVSLLVWMHQKSVEKGKNSYFLEHITQLQVWARGRCHFQSLISKLLRCECFWTLHILQIYQNTSVLNSSMPFPCLAVHWFYWESGGVIWKRTCWRYARQAENERETRMYCKILFSSLLKCQRIRKKRKITKRFMFVIVCLLMPHDLAT